MLAVADNYTLGENTPYGQQNMQYLKAVANHGWDVDAMQTAFFDFYGAKDAPCALHATEDDPCPPWQPNVTCCYWDSSTQVFVANVQNNATCLKDRSCGDDDDMQGDALTHMLLPAALGAGSLDLGTVLSNVNDVVRITQNTDDAQAFGSAGARVLVNAIAGESVRRRRRCCLAGWCAGAGARPHAPSVIVLV